MCNNLINETAWSDANGSQNISKLLLLVNNHQDILLYGYFIRSAKNKEFSFHIPMSLMVSPGSKGGSSISANLLVSLRT